MKKLVVIILPILFIYSSLFGQVVFPEVFSSFGGTAKNSSIQLTWTLGETLYETVSNNSNIMTQGFNQISQATPVESIKASDISIIAYPNPTSSLLYVNIQSSALKKIQLEIIDTQGRLLFTQKNSGSIDPIDLTAFSGGLYFLKITDENKVATIIKIQKIK